MAEAKKKSMSDVLSAAFRKHDVHIGPLSSIAEDVLAIPSGNIAIDSCIGVGGLPLGRSVELFGPPSSGKTTTALQSAAELQHLIISGGDRSRGISPTDVIAYFDYEQSMDPKYAKALGLDVDHKSFQFAQPESLEQGANLAREMLDTGELRMCIWDSVAAMTPSAKLEAETGKSLPAVQAKLMSEFLSAINASLRNNNCVAVYVNHIMELMDMGRRPGMPPRTSTPGGRALKFYASVRIEYQQIGNIKGKVLDPLSNTEIDQVLATNVKVRVVKNKVAPPFKQAVVRVRYGKGFDNFWTALQILIAHKKIVYSGGYFYFERSPELVHPAMQVGSTANKRPYVRGEESIFAFADEHTEWRDLMIRTANEVLNRDPNAVDAITPVKDTTADDEQDSLVVDGEDLLTTSPQLVEEDAPGDGLVDVFAGDD